MGNCLYNVLCAYRTFGGVNGIGCYTYFFRVGDRHITLKMVGNLHDNINRTTLQFLHGKVEFISCFNQCQIFGGFDMRHNALRRCRAVQVNNRNKMTRDYAYYLENRLRARYGLDGVPVIIDVRERKDRRSER